MSQNPSIAIKTATELLAADRKDAALQALGEAFLRKNKNQWQPEMEVVITMMLDICVKTQNLKAVKDGLHQYRSICQPTNINSLEKVINEFLQKGEAALQDAKENSARSIANNVEEETIESMILRSISGEDLQERSKKLALQPHYKFLWESFRAILDLVKNKQKLENVYHTTAVAAMNFCVNNERKQEFKRIGEMLRSHFTQLTGTTQPLTTPASIANAPASLITPSSLNHLFNIRFEYLNAAVKLELWQEAFKTVEDINEIITTIQRQPPAQLLANYYEKLAQLFLVSHNYLYHSYAWLRFYVLSKNQHLSLKEEEVQQIASVVLVSALAIPIEGSTNQFNNQYFELNLQKEKNSRLTSLLGLSNSNLTRESLLKEIYQIGVPSNVLPGPLRDLYNLMEVKFQPLELSKSLEKSFEFIQGNDKLAKYLPLVKKAAFTRQLQALSKVYQTMKLSQIHSLSPFNNPDTTEKSIIKAANLKLISARIDHQQQIITFNNLSLLESGTIKNQLTVVYEKLSQAVKLIDPERENKRIENKCKFLATVDKNMDREYEENVQRIEEIEGEKEREEYYEKKRARLQLLKQQLEQAKAPKTVEAASPAPAVPKEKTEKEIQKERQLKVQKEQEQKRETLLKQFYKTVISLDYLERARRENEAPLLEKWFEDASKKDRELNEQITLGNLERAKLTHANELKEKSRLSRIRDVADGFKEKQLSGKRESFEKNLAEVRKKNEEIKQQIDVEIAKIKQEIIQRRAEEKIKEEERRVEESRRKEEEEAKREEARRKAEQQAEEEKNKPEPVKPRVWGDKNSSQTGSTGAARWKTDESSKPSVGSDSNNWRNKSNTQVDQPNIRPGWGNRSTERQAPEDAPSRKPWSDDRERRPDDRRQDSRQEEPRRDDRRPGWGNKPTNDEKPSVADSNDNWRARPAANDKPVESAPPSRAAWGNKNRDDRRQDDRRPDDRRPDERRQEEPRRDDRRQEEPRRPGWNQRPTDEKPSVADSDDNWRARPAANDKPVESAPPPRAWGNKGSNKTDPEPRRDDRRPDERRQEEPRRDDRRPDDRNRNRGNERRTDNDSWRKGKDQPATRKEQLPRRAEAEPSADEDGFVTVPAKKGRKN